MSFDAAADALYAGSLSTFVAERKRLSAELKAAGDKAGAATLNKLGRPVASAWAVNQLYRQARAEWDALLAVTEQLRQGDFSAVAMQRAALAVLRVKAIEVLKGEGNAASEAVLARIETNLLAIAATGWSPDAPGRLVDDRAAPGFDALAGFAAAAASAGASTAVAPVETVTPAPAMAAAADETVAPVPAPSTAPAPSEPVASVPVSVVPRREDLDELQGRVDACAEACDDARDEVVRAQALVEQLTASLASAERDLRAWEARVAAADEHLLAARAELERTRS